MATPLPALAEHPTDLPLRTLGDLWADGRKSVQIGLCVFALCVVLWIAVTGFELHRLWRTGPWELISMATVCIGMQMSLTALRRFMAPDPTGGRVMEWVVVCCAFWLILSQIAIKSTAGWVYTSGLKSVHALNGAVLASILGLAVYAVWVLFAGMRLSALEPGREARMRDAAQTKLDREIDPNQPAASRSTRWQANFRNWSRWRFATTPQSQMLDVFIWPRVILCTLINSIVVSFASGLLISIAIAVGFFGEIGAATVRLAEIEKALPRWFGEGGFVVLISSGTWALAAAQRFAKWINHSLSAATSVVWVAHLGAASMCAVLVGEAPALPGVQTMIFIVSILSAMRPISVISARAEAIAAATQLVQREVAARAEGQRALALADLKALQAQIEPHFLYNTLANLQLLIRLDATRADAMTGHLIDYLRARLPLMREPLAPLSSEIEMVRSYLEILKIRMGERLQSSFDVPPDCEAISVPTLVVMTLIENAVKHGLEPKRGGGDIDVTARRDGDWLVIRVADTGVGFGASNVAGTGVGLANITERLRLSYPDARDAHGQSARVELLHNEPQGVIAVLHIPA